MFQLINNYIHVCVGHERIMGASKLEGVSYKLKNNEIQ